MEKPESVHWPCPTVEHPGTPILHREKFSSADGLGTFFGIEYRPPAEVAAEAYPVPLMTGRLLFHYHTRVQTGRCKVLNYEAPEAFVQINTIDAARLGISDGEKVSLRSRRGEIAPIARVTDEVAPGVLYMSMHFGTGAVNLLTNGALDPMSKMPELKHCAVAIKKIAGVN
jgi:formate dehydrogenase major subunit